MVDRHLYSDKNTTQTGFTIQPDNIFVENGEFKEPGLTENIAQTAAVRSGYTSAMENKPAPVGYIGSISKLEIMALTKTGDELITEIIIENQIFDVTLISGKITCNEKIIAQCKMKIFINQNKNS